MPIRNCVTLDYETKERLGKSVEGHVAFLLILYIYILIGSSAIPVVLFEPELRQPSCSSMPNSSRKQGTSYFHFLYREYLYAVDGSLLLYYIWFAGKQTHRKAVQPQVELSFRNFNIFDEFSLSIQKTGSESIADPISFSPRNDPSSRVRPLWPVGSLAMEPPDTEAQCAAHVITARPPVRDKVLRSPQFESKDSDSYSPWPEENLVTDKFHEPHRYIAVTNEQPI